MSWRLIVITLFGGALPVACLSTTWNVFVDGSGDAPTIQAALDLVDSGDTVLVYPGTYREIPNLPFGNDLDELTFIGAYDSEVTNIDLSDGEYAGYASFYIKNLEMSGVCFMNGSFSCNGEFSYIHYCIFRDLRACSAVEICWPNISLAATENIGYSRFEDNIVTGCYAVGEPNILANNVYSRGNLFSNNSIYSDIHYESAGVYRSVGTSARIVENRFVDNYADGGIIEITGYQQLDELIIKNNIFYMTNNYGSCCTAISYWGNPIGFIENNIFVGLRGAIGYAFSHDDPLDLPKCNIVWNVDLVTEVLTEENWNFNVDPQFCHAATGDFTVSDGSMCLPENHPEGMDCGLIGIYGPGCPTPAKSTSWGRLKSIYGE
ncbi:MAG: hypothetical protein KJ927_06565 [Candidatus Eisenbacteria bacterium]|nr:hypothetical protein [Candidatus Eisenbacteria bacterium]